LGTTKCDIEKGGEAGNIPLPRFFIGAESRGARSCQGEYELYDWETSLFSTAAG